MDIIEKFESIEAFRNTINSREVDDFHKDLQPSQTGSKDFTGTESYEEAERLLTEGDTKSASLIITEEKKRKATTRTTTTRNAIYNAPAGFVPNIPRLLAGNPNNMLNVRQQKYRNSKVITLIVNTSTPGSTDVKTMIKFGANVLSAVLDMEKKGYRFNIYVATTTKHRSTKNSSLLLVKIKDAGKPLNVTNCAYPLVNPSFFRRHIFRWFETNNNKTNDFCIGFCLDDKNKQNMLYKKALKQYVSISLEEHFYLTSDDMIQHICKQM